MRNISILFFYFLTINCYSQLKKANNYFDNFEYANAIPYYEKEINKKDSLLVFDKLASCYFFIGDYEKAEKVYQRITTRPDIESIQLFNYGRILQYNRKYPAAKTQFLKYAKANPKDKRGETFAKSCEIRSWKDSLFGVNITNLFKINTQFSEFSPTLYDKQIYFVSDRPKNYVEYDKQNWTLSPFTAIFSYTEDSKDTTKFSINPVAYVNSDGHNGPISFSVKKKQTVFMRIEEKSLTEGNKINKAKIFEGKLENGKITEIIPFDYNSDNFSCGHPSFTPDGETIFFTSDMPGGFGGKDIYYCKMKKKKWSKPINLGSEINTEGDEIFPFVKNDSLLYFSSNGHPGYGGLDIFSAYKNNNGWKVTNLRMPINSSGDDYGVYFSSENNGYFSSNRKGGKGQEDIYEFQIISSAISGEFFSTDNSPKKRMKLYLLNHLGTVVDSAYTNDVGFFAFTKLKPDQDYIILIKGEDVDFKGYASFDANQDKILKIYVADKQNNIIDTLYTDKESFFASRQNITKIIDIKGKILLSKDSIINAQNIGVLLKNEKGILISSTITNKDGYYEFKNLKGDQNYLVTLDESNPSFDNNIKYIILGNIFSKGNPVLESNVKLWFGNKFDEKIFSMVLDKDGLYRFEYLPSEQYALRLKNATNVEWEKIDINLKKEKENKEMVIIENIYFKTDKWDILPAGEKVLNKAIQFLKTHPEVILELGAHTDSRASDEYNLELSQKRAQSAVDYMVSNGAKQNQLKAVGYGETRLLNKCKNNVPCSEDEHKINRRMEFKIIWK